MPWFSDNHRYPMVLMSLKSIEELHVSKALQDNGYFERFVHSSRHPHVQLHHQKWKGLLPSLSHT